MIHFYKNILGVKYWFKVFTTASILIFSYEALSQEKSLELTQAYELAEAKYPTSANKDLIDSIYSLNTKLLNKERLPEITANAQGQVQTENLTLGVDSPDSPIFFELPLESYKTYLDANFFIYDGGLVSSKRRVQESSLQVNQQSLKVTLRNLKDRVNKAYFMVLLAQQQQQLLSTSLNNLKTTISEVQAKYSSGIVLESELTKLMVRELELLSDYDQLSGDLKAYLSVLEELVGVSISEATTLITPKVSTDIFMEIERPEAQLFNYQMEALEAQKSIVSALRMPKVGLFAQGGVGYPNPVNFAAIETATYALGGVRINWEVYDWGKVKKEKEILELEKQQLEAQKHAFKFDIESRKAEFIERIRATEKLLENDKEIVGLQQSILKQSDVQLANGVINSNDYLLQVNAALQAEQKYEFHKVQLEQLKIEYLTLIGKL
ncbi:TolC family protein [Galbibacter sp. BG1]|uniref:TolC family protein n=1 Tax=Galbibacter sp. BG1 TaxID=1170699 RepID=UPI0015BBA8D9|nr:TolC family protein [Galbibacter sp. BG1]QLE00041.1 TolC family protein [Galbibacter sp. BG1]